MKEVVTPSTAATTELSKHVKGEATLFPAAIVNLPPTSIPPTKLIRKEYHHYGIYSVTKITITTLSLISFINVIVIINIKESHTFHMVYL